MVVTGSSSDEQGVSTLLLVGDTEYELHVSTGTLSFGHWGSSEARGTKRALSFSVALIKRASDDESEDTRGATPLVITAPLTARFQLRPDEGCSLMPLLRGDKKASPLRFFVEFVPPENHESDSAWINFQDQVVIQSRLARLNVRLHAMRESDSVKDCTLESFQPQLLPSVKAPSFKLFEQIEKDAVLAANTPMTNSTHRPSVSSSFHPHKNPGQSLTPLPAPTRQPTPPHPSLSRPPSSDGRRTASPRVLEPLESMPSSPRVTADVTNLTEAREVIRRLRSRRSSQTNATKPSGVTETIESPVGPESRLDAKAKAELDKFNAIVKSAKRNVAGEMNKAKDELDFYKSLLPKQPVAEPVLVPEPGPQLISADKGSAVVSRVGAALPKKPARLPTLTAEESKPNAGNNANFLLSNSNNNQELSPVKRIQPKLSKAPSKVKQPEEPLQTAPVRGQTPKATTVTRKPPSSIKPQPQTQQPVAKSSKAPQPSKPTPTGSKEKTPKTKPKQPSKAPGMSATSDDALLDFDDADPEVDDAPWQPDDLQRNLADDDEDDLMLTMKVPL